jgi:putative two-component system response regulator
LKATEFTDARILVVDDEQQNVMLLQRVLTNAGYTNISTCTDPRDVMPLVAAQEPDVILLDLSMPHMAGTEILETLSQKYPSSFLPVLVLTADASREARERSLDLGAKDFLTKPFDITEVQLRVRNLLETRSLYVRLRDHNAMLDQRVKERTRELEEAQHEILDRLTITAEYRDDVTGQHTKRVADLSARIAETLGLPADDTALIRAAAPLHDVGKVAIPDAILLKPGPLTSDEMDIMRKHTDYGVKILSGSNAPLLKAAESIAGTHHERWDGTGYPAGLRGEEIPIEGRIVSVADVFDALTHERPYKSAWSIDAARALIQNGAESQFDARVVNAFLDVTAVSDSEDDDEIDVFSAFRSFVSPGPAETS